jgi:hypothetical protein
LSSRVAGSLAFLVLVLSTVTACGAGFTAEPPVERCGEALYNPRDLPVVKIPSATSLTRAVFLELTTQCVRGATVGIAPPTVATISQSIRAKDKKLVIIELDPARAGKAPTIGTLTVDSPDGLFTVALDYTPKQSTTAEKR